MFIETFLYRNLWYERGISVDEKNGLLYSRRVIIENDDKH